MERLESLNGTIFKFRKQGIYGHIAVVNDGSIYAYVIIPDNTPLPFYLEITNQHKFLVISHGYIHLGFPEDKTEIAPIPALDTSQNKTSPINDMHIKSLKRFINFV
jgi:hypothetical protein